MSEKAKGVKVKWLGSGIVACVDGSEISAGQVGEIYQSVADAYSDGEHYERVRAPKKKDE